MTVVSPLWCNLLFLVILAPVFEEIFLRKLIIDRLRPYGELAAILLSGIAFGLVHGNLHQLLYACASGILFGWIYVKTGNIVVNISLHATLNFIGGVYASEIEKLTRGNDWNGLLQNPAALADVLNIVYAVLLGVCALVCIILLARIKAWAPLVRLNAAELPLTRRDWRVALWTNHFVWFFLVFFVLLLFI